VSAAKRGIIVTTEAARHGLEAARMPGRLEVARRRPLVVLDGAHNVAGLRALRESLAQLAPAKRLVLLFAAMADKDIGAMAGEIGPIATRVVLTQAPGTDRAAPTSALAAAFAPQATRIEEEPVARRALHRCLEELTADDMLLITGSLYLVGHLRRELLQS
jgi:dihydrofolate synthase/folylpolyglutamate synthase